ANYISMADVGAGKKPDGHTGFTGTCFWIDPDKELIYIFLSNRVNPTRENSAFSKVNPRVGVLSAIYRNLIAD
ncbi:MAG: beta-lactamase family protein, partial [Paramuribaculum sp.]|nr:beta-lactamase family protein [Paramuribaculum sp.]